MTKLGWTKRQALLLICVWLAFLSSFVTRLSWSSIMPTALKALHFSVSQGAFYISAFYIGYAITVLPGGMMADRLGYKKVILISLTSMIIFTVPMYFLNQDSYTMGLIYRFLLGFFSGPLHSSCMSAIGDYFLEKQRGTAVGIYMTGTSLGITLVNSLAPFISTTYGWRFAFIAVSFIPLIVLILSLFGINSSGSTKHKKEASSINKTSIFDSIQYMLTNKNILFLAISGLFATGTTWGVTTWANLYMVKQLGITTIMAGSVMSTYGIAALITKPCAGYLADVIPMKQNRLAALFLFLFSPAIIVFALNNNPHLLYIMGPMLGIGAFIYSPLVNTLGIQAAPANLRGTTVGFINLFNQIGVLSAPILLSRVVVHTGNYQDSLLTISIFPIIGAIALLFMKLKPTHQ